VISLTRVTQLTAGDSHNCALRDTGRAFCWGWNANGQLGDGTTSDRSLPVRVVGLTGVTQAAAGAFHSCALRLTGRVFCWGGNGRGQLGDGTTTRRNTQVRVAGLTRVTQVAAGDQHNCALRESGRAFCWGNNRDSQLGFAHPDFQPRASKRVTGLTGIAHVAAGRSHSCAIQTDGQAWCWGSNNWGQLGDNTRLSRQTPVRVVD
jgi:alpha-tubulin suppressor-like RCC1 family protein